MRSSGSGSRSPRCRSGRCSRRRRRRHDPVLPPGRARAAARSTSRSSDVRGAPRGAGRRRSRPLARRGALGSSAAAWSSRSTTASATSTSRRSPSSSGTGLPALLYLATGFVDAGDPRSGVGPDGGADVDDARGGGVDGARHDRLPHARARRPVGRGRSRERRRDAPVRRSSSRTGWGRPCAHFAFPWGKASPAAERVARRWFATAALEAWKTNRSRADRPHRLGRTPVMRSDGGFFFRAKARGQLDGERLAYRALRRGPWAPA